MAAYTILSNITNIADSSTIWNISPVVVSAIIVSSEHTI